MSHLAVLCIKLCHFCNSRDNHALATFFMHNTKSLNVLLLICVSGHYDTYMHLKQWTLQPLLLQTTRQAIMHTPAVNMYSLRADELADVWHYTFVNQFSIIKLLWRISAEVCLQKICLIYRFRAKIATSYYMDKF